MKILSIRFRESERPFARGAIACLVALSVAFAPLVIRPAYADRDQAREHYTRGKALFEQGEYEAAIGEFAAADKLAPSPILEFNLALCYDRLGERKEALRRYRIYLDRMPGAKNRAAVEEKIQRLEAALRQDEARRAAKEAEAEEETGAAAGNEEADIVSGSEGATGEAAGSEAEARESAGDESEESAAASERDGPPPAPEKPTYEPTGDPELDRVAAVDVAAIRQERMGPGQPVAEGDPGAGSEAAAGGEPAAAGEPGPSGEPPPPPGEDKKKDKSDPIYKQWWFWVVVGVSAIILIDIASSGSSDNNNSARQRFLLPETDHEPAPGGGAVLWRF